MELAVSGTPDGDIDLNKLYTDDEVAALKYKDVYKTMTLRHSMVRNRHRSYRRDNSSQEICFC